MKIIRYFSQHCKRYIGNISYNSAAAVCLLPIYIYCNMSPYRVPIYYMRVFHLYSIIIKRIMFPQVQVQFTSKNIIPKRLGDLWKTNGEYHIIIFTCRAWYGAGGRWVEFINAFAIYFDTYNNISVWYYIMTYSSRRSYQ